MTVDVVLSSILALYVHGFSTFVQPVVSLSFEMLAEKHCWSLVLQPWLGLVWYMWGRRIRGQVTSRSQRGATVHADFYNW